MAGVAGLLAIFAPAGLGVREGVLMIILPGVIGTEAAIVVSLASRIWFTAAELICAGVGWVVLRRTGEGLMKDEGGRKKDEGGRMKDEG